MFHYSLKHYVFFTYLRQFVWFIFGILHVFVFADSEHLLSIDCVVDSFKLK